MKLPLGNNQRVYNCGDLKPDEIRINGHIQTDASQCQYDFSQDINEVILVWRRIITSCYRMFFFVKLLLNWISLILTHHK